MSKSALIVAFAVLAACGTRPPPLTSNGPPPPIAYAPRVVLDPTPLPGAKLDADGCKELHDQGMRLHDAGDYDRAITTYQRAIDSGCAHGLGLFGEIGYSLDAKGEHEEAVAMYLREITLPLPTKVAFGNLFATLDHVTAKTRNTVLAAGHTREAPIFVPDVAYEHLWIERAACLLGKGEVKRASPVEGKSGKLDQLEITCPNEGDKTLYFDAGAGSSK
jgi:hypothetical protein